MSTSLPSLMTRRKKIDGTRIFNTAKVIPDYSPCISVPDSSYAENFQKKNINGNVQVAAGKDRKNSPNYVTFLFENPRLINEPICYTNSKETNDNQSKWWPEKVSYGRKPILCYKADSISRSHFSDFENKPVGLTRFGCNKNRMNKTNGIVPSLNLGTEALVATEKISYEHQFNCRKNRTERGKLRGSFVWEPVADQRIIDRIKLRMRQQSSSVFA